MNWKNKVFKNFKLYAVTDLSKDDPEIFKKVEAAYRGGADIIQLRSKRLSDAELYRIGIRFRKIANRYHKLFFVNDRLDLALAVGADGLHLGQDDLPVGSVKKMLGGRSLFVGRSTHSLPQALAAIHEGVDYIGVGPIFETPTKPSYPPVGTDLIRQVAQKIRIPFVCIGGIDRHNIRQVLAAGANRIAVVRAVFQAPNVFKATQMLRKEIERDEK